MAVILPMNGPTRDFLSDIADTVPLINLADLGLKKGGVVYDSHTQRPIGNEEWTAARTTAQRILRQIAGEHIDGGGHLLNEPVGFSDKAEAERGMGHVLRGIRDVELKTDLVARIIARAMRYIKTQQVKEGSFDAAAFSMRQKNSVKDMIAAMKAVDIQPPSAGASRG